MRSAKCEVFIVNGGDLSCMCVQKSIHWWSDQCEFWCSRVCISVTCSVLLQHEGLLKVSIGLLEASWDVFGDVLGRLGSVFRTYWARLGSVLGASWGVFGASWRRPRVFFRFSGALKPYWDRLGAVLEAPGSALEASWRRFGGAWQRLGGVLEASWRFWSCLWSDITPIVDF